MRSKIEEYNAVVEAASKFTKSVAEGNSKYAKELFTEDACLFGFLNGKFERGSIEQFYPAVSSSSSTAFHRQHYNYTQYEEFYENISPCADRRTAHRCLWKQGAEE